MSITMKLRIILAALALTGCMTAQSNEATIVAKKVLTAAHTLHDGLAISASAAARSGACIAACAVKVKDLLDKSEALLVAADGLQDPSNISADVDAAIKLITEAQKGL